jgi:hypothetical protein
MLQVAYPLVNQVAHNVRQYNRVRNRRKEHYRSCLARLDEALYLVGQGKRYSFDFEFELRIVKRSF